MEIALFVLEACRCWPMLYPDTLQIKLQSPLDQRQEHLRIPAVGVSGSMLSAQLIGPADCRQVPWVLSQLLVLALRVLPANKPYQADSDCTMVLTPDRERASYIHPPRSSFYGNLLLFFSRKGRLSSLLGLEHTKLATTPGPLH